MGEWLYLYPFEQKGEKMKKTAKLTLILTLAAVLALCLAACTASDTDALWETADYTADTELGEGSKIITVEVKAIEKTITFTIKTDAKTVGEALIDNELIDGDVGAYGLYVKKVNGMLADYDVNQRYWAFYIDGEMALTGVDATPISEDSVYRLEYAQ